MIVLAERTFTRDDLDQAWRDDVDIVGGWFRAKAELWVEYGPLTAAWYPQGGDAYFTAQVTTEREP